MKKKLSEQTLEELYAEKKKRKGILTVFGVLMLIACGTLIFLAAKSENYALFVVASGSFITLLPLIASLKQVEKEIKSREQK